MRSLRGRLTVGITFVVAIVLAGAGLVVSRYVDQSERQALDERLQSIVELSRGTALSAVERELPGRDRRLDNVLSATGTSLRLLLDGRELPAFGRPLPPGRPAVSDGFDTFEAGGQRYRSYTIRLEELGGLTRLEVTTRLAPTERKLSELNRRLLGFGAAALLMAALGVWFAADVILRPLRRLRRATAGIAGTEDLDRRVAGDVGPAELRSLAESFNEMLARLGRSAADRERALAENRRLVTLLDGLQGLARGDAPPPQLDDVELGDLVAVTLASAEKRYPGVAWTCELPDEPVVVRGWEPGLRIIVDNLVHNAARHGGGTVAVTLSARSALGAGPELVVEDDGAGVAAPERERIFEPFVRADGTEAPGSGLGLALVSQQVRAHRATVDVGEAALGGARFTVRFAGGG